METQFIEINNSSNGGQAKPRNLRQTTKKQKLKIDPKYRNAVKKSNSKHKKTYELQKGKEDQKLTKSKPIGDQCCKDQRSVTSN